MLILSANLNALSANAGIEPPLGGLVRDSIADIESFRPASPQPCAPEPFTKDCIVKPAALAEREWTSTDNSLERRSWHLAGRLDMGLLDQVFGGTQAGSRGGASPVTLGLLALLAYRTYEGKGRLAEILGRQPSPAGAANSPSTPGPAGLPGAATGDLGALIRIGWTAGWRRVRWPSRRRFG
jgi:hypothetical protein